MKNLTAVILCGGKGIRLRPITNDLPKPMIKVGGKPILEHHLNSLYKFGITAKIIMLFGIIGRNH